jgi:hypothetical protein
VVLRRKDVLFIAVSPPVGMTGWLTTCTVVDIIQCAAFVSVESSHEETLGTVTPAVVSV